jgi:hypothetical protein
MNTKFNQCYSILLEMYMDDENITHIFIDNNCNEIYNSKTESRFSRTMFKNYTKNIVAFMFLNFLLNYHCFLIIYKGLNCWLINYYFSILNIIYLNIYLNK